MSRKTIAFASPRPAAAPPPAPAADREAWVLADAPEPDVHVADARAVDARAVDTRAVIDLTAPRSLIELAQLVWVFPALATMFWISGRLGAARE